MQQVHKAALCKIHKNVVIGVCRTKACLRQNNSQFCLICLRTFHRSCDLNKLHDQEHLIKGINSSYRLVKCYQEQSIDIQKFQNLKQNIIHSLDIIEDIKLKMAKDGSILETYDKIRKNIQFDKDLWNQAGKLYSRIDQVHSKFEYYRDTVQSSLRDIKANIDLLFDIQTHGIDFSSNKRISGYLQGSYQRFFSIRDVRPDFLNDFLNAANWNNITLSKTINQNSQILATCISPDSKYVACTLQKNLIKIWHVGTGKQVASQFIYIVYEMNSISISANNKYVISSNISDIALWNVSNQTIKTAYGFQEVRMVAFKFNEFRFTSLHTDQIILWDIDKNDEMVKLRVIKSTNVRRFQYSPNGNLILTKNTNTSWIQLYNANSATIYGSRYVKQLQNQIFSTNSSKLYLQSYTKVFVASVKNLTVICSISINRQEAWKCLSPNQTFAVTVGENRDKGIHIINLRTGSRTILTMDIAELENVEFTPDYQYLVISYKRSVRVLNMISENLF